MATASLVCGIAGLLLFFLFVLPVLAVVFGAIAISRAREAPGPGSGVGRAKAGLVLGIIGLLLFGGIVVIGAIAGWYDDDDVAAIDLEVGQCVTLDVDATEVARLPVVECSEVHQGEVYAVADIEGGDEYPGESTVIARAEELCAGDRFTEFVGVAYLESIYEIYTIYPIDDTWEDGDREVVCLVVDAAGDDLTGSLEGVGE